MAKHIIHVNRQNIAMNNKDGANRPVYTIKSKGFPKARYTNEIYIDGPSKMVYNPKGLSCGAKAYIETDADVTLVNETDFEGSRKVVDKDKKDMIQIGMTIRKEGLVSCELTQL